MGLAPPLASFPPSLSSPVRPPGRPASSTSQAIGSTNTGSLSVNNGIQSALTSLTTSRPSSTSSTSQQQLRNAKTPPKTPSSTRPTTASGTASTAKLASNASSAANNRGRWCAMHVQIAWLINNQQQRQMGQLQASNSLNTPNLTTKSQKISLQSQQLVAGSQPTGSPLSKHPPGMLGISPSLNHKSILNSSFAFPQMNANTVAVSSSANSLHSIPAQHHVLAGAGGSLSASLEMMKGMNNMFAYPASGGFPMPGGVPTVAATGGTNPSLSIGRPPIGMSSFSSSLLTAAAAAPSAGGHQPSSTSNKPGDNNLMLTPFLYPPGLQKSPATSASSAYGGNHMQMQRRSPLHPGPQKLLYPSSMSGPTSNASAAAAAVEQWNRAAVASSLGSYSSAIARLADGDNKLQRPKEPCRSPIRSNSKGPPTDSNNSNNYNAAAQQQLMPSRPNSGMGNNPASNSAVRRREQLDKSFKRELSVSPHGQLHGSKMMKPNPSADLSAKSNNGNHSSNFNRAKEEALIRSKDQKPAMYAPGFSYPPAALMGDPMTLERQRMFGMFGGYPGANAYAGHALAAAANGLLPHSFSTAGLPGQMIGSVMPGQSQMSNGLPPQVSLQNSLTGSLTNGIPSALAGSGLPNGSLPSTISSSLGNGMPPSLAAGHLTNGLSNPLAAGCAYSNLPPTSNAAAVAAAEFQFWSQIPSFYAAAAAAAAGVPGAAQALTGSGHLPALTGAPAPIPSSLSVLQQGQPIPPNMAPALSNPFKNLHDFTRNGFLERENLLNRYNILNSTGGGAPLTEKLAKDSAEKRVFVNS